MSTNATNRMRTASLSLATIALLALTTFGGAGAQDSDASDVLDSLREIDSRTLDEQVAICEIPAPPFQEQARAEDYARRLSEIGLQNVRIDAVGNVLSELTGSSEGPLVVLSAHLDTVFPPGTDVTVTREGDLLRGPGIVDDCRGLAVVLAVARAWVESGLRPAGTLMFVATVGEEGEGNLRGVRHLFGTELVDRIDAFISVDGAGSDITHIGVGSNRYRVTYKGPGGHSYGAFGMPNPMHALGRAIAKIADFQVPTEPRVTFNVGVLDGGTSVNSIPFSATMSVDMRSVDVNALEEIDSEFHGALQAALEEENSRWDSDVELSYEIEIIGIRPAGQTPESSAIVQAALRTARDVGLEPRLGNGSTDSNIAMSLGIPAVTIDGGGRGTGAHSPTVETFDTRDSYLGVQWAFLLSRALAMPDGAMATQGNAMSFFLTSAGPGTGADLGGLAGADQHCQRLATGVGAGDRTWRAYLSAATAGTTAAVNARDRIGSGPWFNAAGVRVASDVEDLHGDNNLTRATVLNESGGTVNGRGDSPNRHDILTGSGLDGTLQTGEGDTTCGNWTRSGEGSAQVGHFDRTGGGANPTSWNSAHASRGCSQENLRGTGGDGLFYCFAID